MPIIVSLVIASLFSAVTGSVNADPMPPLSTESVTLEYLDLRLTPEILNSQTQPNRPDFSGTWIFDPAASDDPEEVLKPEPDDRKKAKSKGSIETADRRPDGGPDGLGPGGKGPGGRGKGMDGNAGPRKSMQSLIKELKLTTLIIQHKEPVFEIVIRGIEPRVMYTDYRYSYVTGFGGSGQITATTGWEDAVLVVHFDSGPGKRIIQRFMRLSEPDRLQRITELSPEQPGKKVVSITQIFQLKTLSP